MNMKDNLLYLPGPIHVQVLYENKLVQLEHVADLIKVLSSTECVDLERDLQEVLDIWCRAKGISLHGENSRCSFCWGEFGVSVEYDGRGTSFYCCGACYARVLHGGIMPDDIRPLLKKY